jgi:type I restriction enzyme M protein
VLDIVIPYGDLYYFVGLPKNGNPTLTNSSSQYVRDGIEEKFRIVGVVSLPQTAFTNTGAGVKSSVLFLKKHDSQTTNNIRTIKRSLQDELAFKLQLEKLHIHGKKKKLN